MENNIIESERNDIQSTTDMVLNYRAMEQMNALAVMMSNGKSTVPQHLQGNPADCMAIVMQAAQWKMNPFAVAQKTHVVSGTLGYEAQLVNAVISSSRAIVGRFHYEYGGDWSISGAGVGVVEKQQKGHNQNLGTQMDGSAWVRVGAILAGETEITWGEPLYPAMVKVKNSPLWLTNPKQQAAYLATKYWARLYAPAVILGVYSSDELEQRPRTEKVVTDDNQSLLNQRMAQAKQDQATVEQAGDATEVHQEELQQPALSNLREKLEVSMLDCSNMDELTEVGEAVARALTENKITTQDRKELGAIFKKRHQTFAQCDLETGEVI